MESLGLIVGHMVGDYIVQNDWMAANKTIWGDAEKHGKSIAPKVSNTGHFACFVHCLCYTLSVWACSFWWMPWWGLLACFAIHFPIDRWRLAGWWMRNVSGQSAFANGPLSPWSIIIVDNTFHLLTLFVIGKISDGICC